MAYLVEIWLILESDLVERAPREIFVELIWTVTHNTTEFTLTNIFGLTELGSGMKKLWRFYPKHLFLTSFGTSHKPYFPQR